MPRLRRHDRTIDSYVKSRRNRIRAGVESLESRAMLTAIGSLDPSFGTGGFALRPASSPPAFVGLTAIEIPGTATNNSYDSSGSIEVAGLLQKTDGTRAFGLEKLKVDGTLDPTFGTNGIVTIPLPGGFSLAPPSISKGPALFQNGQVIDLAGAVINPSGQTQTLVAQLDSNGNLAAGFGPNNGVNVYDIPHFVVTAGVAENGSSVLVGTVLTADSTANPIGVARVSFLGQLDTSIGSSGLITLTVNNPSAPQSARDEYPVGVAVDDRNRIVVAGRSTLGAEVFRLNPDGSRDISLAGDGLAIIPAFTIPYLSGLALEPTGGDILLLGTQGPTLNGPKAPDLVVHLFANGGTDTLQSIRGLADATPTRFDQIAVQANGDVVLAGLDGNPGASTTPFVVARLRPDLTPDPTFGTFSGQETFGYPNQTATTGATLTGLTLDSVGNPVIIGGNVTTSGTTNSGETFVARLQGSVYSYTPPPSGKGGALDPSFGTSGVVLNPSSDRANAFTSLSTTLVQPDGKILSAGPINTSHGLTEGLLRLGTDGRPDASFGTNGLVVVNLPDGFKVGTTYPGRTTSIQVQPDGKVIVVLALQSTGGSSTSETLVERFNPGGTIDTTFGTSGQVILGGGRSYGVSALQPDGKIILAGSATISGFNSTELSVKRLDSDGSLDTTFSTNGEFTIESPGTSGDFEAATQVAVNPAGKIVLARIAYFPPVPLLTPFSFYSGQILQLNADGSSDNQFGQSGVVYLNESEIALPNVLLLRDDGSMDIFGNAYGTFGIGQVHAVRLNSVGTEVANSGDGLTGYTAVTAAVLEPDGKIVINALPLVGSNTAGNPLILSRLNANFTADLSFGNGAGNTQFGLDLPNFMIYGGGIEALSLSANGAIVAAGSEKTIFGGPTYSFVARLTGTEEVKGDYTGDGKADPAIYLPGFGVFAIRPSEGKADQIIPFGIAGANQTLPAPGDYDGSGRNEIAAYLPTSGVYAYRPASGGPDQVISFGPPGLAVPAPADYEGSGRTNIAIYVPAYGVYAIRTQAGADQITPFGAAGVGQSIPVPGDYDGSGRAELAVYLTALGAYAYRPANGGPDQIIPFGIPGAGQSIPVPGDYDGSGRTELAVYLPAFAEFVYRPARGGPDVVIPFGLAGKGQTLPAIGDYSGLGHDEVGADLPSLGLFAYRPGNGPDILEPFGPSGIGQSIPANLNPVQGQPSLVRAAGFSDFFTPTDDLASISLPGSIRKKHAPGVR